MMNKKSLKKENEKREGSLTIRVFMVYLLVVLASAAVIYRIVDLQISHKDDLRAGLEAKKATIRPIDIPVERGNILSRHNEILVERMPIYKIYMDTYPKEHVKREKESKPDTVIVRLTDEIFNTHVAALGDSLTALFGATTPSWEQKLRAARADTARYFKISDMASKKDYARLQKFPIFYDRERYNPYNALCKPEENLDYVIYPFGDLAGRTLGYSKKNNTNQENDDERILAGIDGYFDKELAGTPGLILRKYIGGIATDIKSDSNIQPQDGYDITTTLDMTMQYIANEALLNALNQYNADKGCVVVMEVATGDIVAMANLSKDSKGNYRETENIALTEYEPGSTFKTASLMVALNDGKVTPNSQIPLSYTSGRTAQVGQRKVVDDHALAVNNPELWYIFAQSSNVGTTRAIYNNYAANQQQFIDGLYKIGFGDTLRFPIVRGDRKPLLRSPSHPMWSKMSISTIPMGYELEVTPLHLLAFYNAIANNGCMVKPRLVSKISHKDETIQTFGIDTLNAQICSEQTLRDIRGMLDSVVSCGTGRRGFLDAPYKVAGKTGTSQIYSPDAKGEKLYNASFCGYFPADNPKYSCIVVIKKPRTGSIYGGAVALPVFRNIADKIYATDFDLMPETKTSGMAGLIKKQSDEQHLNRDKVAFSENTIPDVRGMSLTDAVYILEKAGIATEVKGYGRVKKQSPEANAPLKKNQKVVLELDIES